MVTDECFWHASETKAGQGSIWVPWLVVAFERVFSRQQGMSSRLAALDIILFATTASAQVR
jgi:hypothetical protein